MYKILNKEQFFQQKNNLGCFCDHELNPIHSLYVKHKLSSKMISIHYIYTYLKELFKERFFFLSMCNAKCHNSNFSIFAN